MKATLLCYFVYKLSIEYNTHKCISNQMLKLKLQFYITYKSITYNSLSLFKKASSYQTLNLWSLDSTPSFIYPDNNE